MAKANQSNQALDRVFLVVGSTAAGWLSTRMGVQNTQFLFASVCIAAGALLFARARRESHAETVP